MAPQTHDGLHRGLGDRTTHVNSRVCIFRCQGWLAHVIVEKDGGSACVMPVRLLTLCMVWWTDLKCFDGGNESIGKRQRLRGRRIV
jgi:hypothetical protein